MELLTFPLSPFPGEAIPPGLSVTGAIGMNAGTLLIRHRLTGNISGLAIAPRSDPPERRGCLWEACCFEFFIGERDSEAYLEFNLSPAGHWNVYRFDSYREGMREEIAFSALPFRVMREEDALTVSLEVEAGGLFPPTSALSAAVAAIVRTNAGDASHWALAHPGPRPDFHRRDAFLLDLPA